MRCRLLAVFLVCLPLTAAAQASKTKEIVMPLGRFIELANAIAALDGVDRIIKDGANERVQKDTTIYKFGVGFRVAMSRNLTAIKPIVEAYNKELGDLRSQVGEIKEGSPALARLNDENRRLLAVEQRASLFTFQEAELKLDVNPIPVSVLSGLDPIIEYQK